MANLPGEHIIDDKVWVVKTHSPWCMTQAVPFKCNKILFIVRNPCDAFMSWLELVQNGNHSTKCKYEIEKEYPNYWNEWVEDITDIYGRFFDVYLKDINTREAPMLFVRFEDLLMNPEPELRNIMRFMLGVNDISGTNAERRVNEVIAMGHKATQSTYKIKNTTLKLNAQGKRYNEKQQDLIKNRLAEFIHVFGYAKHPSMPENPTGFFEYPAEHPMQKKFNSFKDINENMIEWAAALSEEDMENIQY